MLTVKSTFRLGSFFVATFLACALCAVARAAPPDSLAGYSYFASYGHPLVPSLEEVSVELNADGTYIEHWFRSGTPMNASLYGIPGDYSLPGAGTYTYTVNSARVGTLVLTSGAVSTWQLTYLTDQTGGLAFQGQGGGSGFTPISGSFILQKLDSSTRPFSNISTMLQVHPGESSTVGFIVTHNGDYLIRIAGPALAQFGIAHPWAGPKFALYNSAGIKLPLMLPQTDPTAMYSPPWDGVPGLAATNTRAFQTVGAFPFAPGSKDAAAVVYLGPGAYTLTISASATDPGGTALVEVYNYQ